MIICFRCTSQAKGLLDKLLRAGEYEDYAEAIEAGLANLAVLHSEIGGSRSLVISEAGDKAGVGLGELSRSAGAEGGLRGSLSVPPIFSLDGLDEAPPRFAQPQASKWQSGDEVPIDGWVFGQYNRLLPAKATCRALAHLLKEYPDGVPIDAARDRISEQALKLGSYLRQHDKDRRIHRDNALSIAFPSNGQKAEKSMLRYADQFVAHADKAGVVHGLPAAYRLIGVPELGSGRLLLTPRGWRFAAAISPVLEERQQAPEEKFSDAEVGLLRGLVGDELPEEDYAFAVVRQILSDGWISPRELDARLQEVLPEPAAAGLSTDFAALQRAGVVSRMLDLELIERRRDGVRVFYRLSGLPSNVRECL
jgi:hypothetical protein